MRDKVNIKNIFHPRGTSWALKEILKSCKLIPTDSGPAKIKIFSLEAYSNIFQRLFRALEQGNKMFQKFVEISFLKRPESINSPIIQQMMDTRIK